MLKKLLGLEESQEIAGVDVSFVGGWLAAIFLTAFVVGLVVYLYRSEDRVTQRRRISMAVFKGLALFIVVIAILKPVADIEVVEPLRRTLLVLLDSSRSMAIEDPRTEAEEVGAAAVALEKLPLGQEVDASQLDALREEVGEVPRFELAKAALAHPEIDFLGKLNEEYQVRFFSFDDQLKPESGANDPAAWLKERAANGEESQVGTAMEEAVACYAGQPIAGVVVLSDFAWANGRDPVQAARDFKQQGIPVYPVTIGLPAPPDIQLSRVIAPDVVFKGDSVPLRVQIESHGFAGTNVELNLLADGEQAMTEQIELAEGVQFAEMKYKPDRKSGTVELELKIDALDGEISDENNSITHKVKIIDEKIKVLYIEGRPRWEYRYLRRVLLRDVQVDVTFIMTEGDPALAAASPNHLARFPQVAKDAFKYDLVILGDVRSAFFNEEQLDLIEGLIRERGGSLLMVAGRNYAPATYGDTPIADMLPVELGDGNWEPAPGGSSLTSAGRKSTVVAFSPDPEITAKIWAKIQPMYLPRLEGTKAGAHVLLTKKQDPGPGQGYPLVAWHRYGAGKSMFVATEDLWRMRREVGDKYHAAFWNQAIKFLTLSRLAGMNKQIVLETDRKLYGAGEQVRIFANVLTPNYEPVVQESYTVVLEKKDTADTATDIALTPVPDSPGVYSGVYLASEDGSFQLKPKSGDGGTSNEAEFEVATVALEDRETGAQLEVAREIAELSGGKSLGLLGMADLPDELGEEEALTKTMRLEFDLWDTPLLFALLVMFVGSEWYMRRKSNLV